MNILMTLSQLEVTGAEAYATTVADRLIAQGHRVTIMSDTLTMPTSASYVPVPFNRRNAFRRLHHIALITRFIRRNRIHVVHTHSRAAGWVSYFAARLCRIPLITTVHGRRHVHFSTRHVRLFGDRALAVCENIARHLVADLGVDAAQIEVLRNPIVSPTDLLNDSLPPGEGPRTIAVIGRLSGPKAGAISSVLAILRDHHTDKRLVCVGGGSELERLRSRFKDTVQFIGFSPAVDEWYHRADVVVGSGRVAAEALARGRAVVGVGEAGSVGFVSDDNLADALSSNFGDVADLHPPASPPLLDEIGRALAAASSTEFVRSTVRREFDAHEIARRVHATYRSEWVRKKRREIPVLMYHRVVEHPAMAGGHGIYVTARQFEAHLQYLRDHGIRTTTLDDAGIMRDAPDDCPAVVLTFDDGYEDNYTTMFPILQKYGCRAVIFLVGGLRTNSWDAGRDGEPEVQLLAGDQIRHMADSGVQFGAHGMLHRKLTLLTDEDLRTELEESRDMTERRSGTRANVFCYPYGDVNERVKGAVREAGYTFGVATDSGPLAIHEDPYQIRRIAVFPNTNVRGFARKVRGDYAIKRASTDRPESDGEGQGAADAAHAMKAGIRRNRSSPAQIILRMSRM